MAPTPGERRNDNAWGRGGTAAAPGKGGLNMLQELTERRPDETSSSQDDDVNDDVNGYTEFKHGMY